MAFGEVGELEHLAAAGRQLDHHAAALDGDRDDAGDAVVDATPALVVAGELNAVALAKLLLLLNEHLRHFRAPVGGPPVDGLALGGVEQPHDPGRGVDALHLVGDVATDPSWRSPLRNATTSPGW